MVETVTDPATTRPSRTAVRDGRPAPDHGRTHPLEAWSDAFADLPDSVGVTVQPFVATVDVRLGDPAAWPEADLPTVPNTWVPTGTGYAVWLGPDEWLLTSTAEASEELEARVRAAVVPLGGSAADVSAQRIILRLTGERVRDVLARGCSIDLHPRVFKQGSSAQTTLGQAGIVLLALSDAGDDYLVFVRSSFAGYLADWLLDAALEFTSR
jgi:sarcosine oxidase subunit gamma